MLIVLDGFGLRDEARGNAIAAAKMPHLKGWMATEPWTKLRASGLDVGLPRGVMGNSEVGHLALGTGRVVYQALTKIGLSLEDGSFFENPVLTAAVDASKGKALHLIGLVSDGGVHAQIEHPLALLELAARRGQRRVFVHAILDGRDMPPRSAAPLLERIAKQMERLQGGRLSTLGGRFFGMDRDQRWERVRQHFDAMVRGKALEAPDWRAALDQAYARGETDEFVQPTRLLPSRDGLLQPGDLVLLWNFRPDRMRQLSRALADPAFGAFPRGAGPWPTTAMTAYDDALPLPVAFPADRATATLGEVVARAGLGQLRIAETEKYAHVTYFFNGGEERTFEGERRILVPSRRDQSTYDKVPEMSAPAITDALLAALEEQRFGLVVLNFANPDMCGHTGVLDATVKGCEAVDACLGRIVPAARAQGFEVFLTSDHGNAELMDQGGQPHKAHTTNPVPLVHLGAGRRALREGGLSDVAPTILDAMGLPKPAAMTGRSLFA
jgi:2,3-bisphosphoglycerate-independent phosphoglycerate mutase